MMEARRVHFSKEDIGGEILPILTRGLYRDTLDALREYVQNAIDAESTRVAVFIDPDVVSVEDDGTGMTAQEGRNAMRLGISEKSPLVNVGFRGIGIYSAFNLCDSLEMFTKSAGEGTTYRLYFDFKRIRGELLAEQERRTQGEPPGLYLERLLEDSVFIEPSADDVIQDHGTKAVMTGILPEAYRRLNDWERVVEYLQDVVPLPFSPDFKYGPIIQEKFEEEDYRVVPFRLQIGQRDEAIYRPYTDAVFRFGGRHLPEFFDLKNGRQVFGFAWVCVNDARETIKNQKIRGLLIKKFGFSIADRRFLEPYFGRTVYNRRITGEVIIQHDDLIPNAGRNDFESNEARQSFLQALPKFTRAVDVWANEIQEDDLAREVLAEVASELSGINAELKPSQRDRERLLKMNAELADIERRLKPHVKRLQVLDSKGLAKGQGLLQGAQAFVKEALVSQRRSAKRMEREAVRAVQRGRAGPTKAERERVESIPTDLISLLDAYGLIDSPEVRGVVEFLDEGILKASLDDDSYSAAIRELRDYLEKNL